MSKTKENEVELPVAIEATTRWRTVMRSLTPTNVELAHAFTIPISDLEQVCEEIRNLTSTGDEPEARAYIGIYDDADGKQKLKLFFVGVSLGYDMLPLAGRNAPAGNIYDVTRPCPPTCDATSLLYNNPQ